MYNTKKFLIFIKKLLKGYCTRINLGLTLNIIGAILIARAMGELPCMREGSFDGGVTGCKHIATGVTTNYRIAYFLSHKKFNLGIILLGSGFFLQLQKRHH